MTEEEKKAATAAAKEEADADTTEEETATEDESEEAGESEEEEEADSTDNSIDYEAELSKEKEARKKAEIALASKRFKSKRAPEAEEDESEDEIDEDKPLTSRELQKILAEERMHTQKEMRAVQSEEIAKKLSGSEAEKNLILEIHKNRTFPEHLSLEDQLEEAYIIANRKRFIGENSELKRALKGKDGINRNAAGSHREAAKGSAPKLAPGESSAFAAVGFIFNTTSRRHEKKLPNGDLLVIDPKTKNTVHIRKK